jgi:hypothetical protein
MKDVPFTCAFVIRCDFCMWSAELSGIAVDTTKTADAALADLVARSITHARDVHHR